MDDVWQVSVKMAWQAELGTRDSGAQQTQGQFSAQGTLENQCSETTRQTESRYRVTGGTIWQWVDCQGSYTVPDE